MQLPLLTVPAQLSRVVEIDICNGLFFSGGGGTCDCGGAPFGCSVKVNNCEPGWRPDCTNNLFQCTCQCMPR